MKSDPGQPTATAPPARSPLVEMLVIAAPVVAAMTSYTLMQFVDKLMVSRISGDPIWVGAQGNGGLASWVPISILMGFLTVINTFVAQNFGNKTPERGPAYVWAGIWISVLYYAFVMVPLGFMLPTLLALGRDAGLSPEELARVVRRDELAAGYGRILVFGSIITLAARGVAQYFYGMHTPVVVLVATVLGNIINLALNSVLVFGPQAPSTTNVAAFDWWFVQTAHLAARLGIPRMELVGSATATVVGTTVELIIPAAVFLSPKARRLYGTARAWRPSLPHIRDLWRIGWPPALMFGNEMLCWAFFMVHLVGRFGTAHSTAGWIAHQWMSLSFMPTVGISVAITAMVGKAIGERRPDVASHRAWMGVALAATYMTICGLCFVIFRNHLIGLFVDAGTPPEEAERIMAYGARFLIAVAAFQFFDGVAMSLSGALKGAGDTRFPSIVTVLLAWSLIVVGGLAVVRLAPGLESLGPWLAAAAYIIVLSTVILIRFLSGKWKSIKLLESSAGTGVPAPQTH